MFLLTPVTPNNQKEFDWSFFSQVILYHVAPVVFEVKPSAMINITANRNMNRSWDEYGAERASIGINLVHRPKIRFFELRRRGKNILVLFYHPTLLTETLTKQENIKLLKNLGYDPGAGLSRCLNFLKTRFQHSCPPESGIFLGIPAGDVTGFIKNRGKNYLFSKYWKVYQNPQYAMEAFRAYDQAKLLIRKEIKIFPDHANLLQFFR